MDNVPLEQLNLATFSEQLNTKFRIQLDPATRVELELTEAKPEKGQGQGQGQAASPGSGPSTSFESFSLVFNGPGDRLLPQRIYPFEHDAIGRFDLFIVPVGQSAGCFQYQAVFMRQTKPAGSSPSHHPPSTAS